MLDIKVIRDNPEQVKQALLDKRDKKADIDLILNLDEQKRQAQFDYDTKKAEQNKVSKQIGELKKQKQDASAIIAQVGQLAEEIKQLKAKADDLDARLSQQLAWVPNVFDASVPVGGEECNRVERQIGTVREFSFELKDQGDLLESLHLADFERGAKLSGSGFPVFTGLGARLERALISFMLDFHTKNHGYTEVWVPYLVNRSTMTGTGQLPKMEEDMYHIDLDDMFLIPTAEVPITNLHAQEILPESELQRKLVGFSPCFRREAGSYGKDSRGLQRVHQFNKVEMVRFTKPEESYAALEEMVEQAGAILQALELPYRVLTLASGDLSFASAKTYDLEVWAPGSQRWLEVSSVSNFEDFQARRANIRWRDAERRVNYVHTLNGSGLATPRTFIAILENWQQEDGSVVIPPALRPYMGGLELIKP